MCPILGKDMKKAAGQGGFQEVSGVFGNPRRSIHCSAVTRCMYRQARQRFARHLAEHRSLTTGRAAARRPSPDGNDEA